MLCCALVVLPYVVPCVGVDVLLCCAVYSRGFVACCVLFCAPCSVLCYVV